MQVPRANSLMGILPAAARWLTLTLSHQPEAQRTERDISLFGKGPRENDMNPVRRSLGSSSEINHFLGTGAILIEKSNSDPPTVYVENSEIPAGTVKLARAGRTRCGELPQIAAPWLAMLL